MATSDNPLDSRDTLLNRLCDDYIICRGSPIWTNTFRPAYETWPVSYMSSHREAPALAALFDAAPVNQANERYIQMDITSDGARVLSKFIRSKSNELESPTVYAELLLPIAEQYGIAKLKQISGQYLCEQLNPANVGRYLRLAQTCSLVDLRKRCLECITTNMKAVMATLEWQQVESLYDELMGKSSRV